MKILKTIYIYTKFLLFVRKQEESVMLQLNAREKMIKRESVIIIKIRDKIKTKIKNT